MAWGLIFCWSASLWFLQPMLGMTSFHHWYAVQAIVTRLFEYFQSHHTLLLICPLPILLHKSQHSFPLHHLSMRWQSNPMIITDLTTQDSFSRLYATHLQGKNADLCWWPLTIRLSCTSIVIAYILLLWVRPCPCCLTHLNTNRQGHASLEPRTLDIVMIQGKGENI